VADETARRLLAAALVAAAFACDRAEPPPAASAPPPAEVRAPISVPVELAEKRFHLELAADPATRYRGLSGRAHIPGNSGMLFAFPESAPQNFVMRDCLVPIDIAYLDDAGRVLAVHTMTLEPPQREGEPRLAYEQRLPRYPSGAPARFAIEVGGGVLAELGLAAGDVVGFDRAAALARSR